MFENADLLVKIVMIGLAFASLVTWTVWIAKTLELRTARKEVRQRPPHPQLFSDASPKRTSNCATATVRWRS